MNGSTENTAKLEQRRNEDGSTSTRLTVHYDVSQMNEEQLQAFLRRALAAMAATAHEVMENPPKSELTIASVSPTTTPE